jgi:hypothetical protein
MTISTEKNWSLADAATPSSRRHNLELSKTTGIGTWEISEIDAIRDPRWAALVESCPQSSLFHTTEWLRALRAVYAYDPVVITTSRPGIPLANGMVFCRIKSWLTGPRLVSLPFSDHCEPLVREGEEFDQLLLRLRRYVDGGKWKYVEVRPISFEPGSNARYGKHLTYCFHLLDLTQDLQQIFRRFHKDCVQRKIRRAEKEKLKYEEGNSSELLHKFYRLMVGMRRRKSLPPQPMKWFESLATEFGKDFKIRVASYGDLPVASIITLSHKKTMTYKYGCSNIAFNRLGGMALLFWKAIQDAKAAGYEQFDLGRSDADNLGLIAFKDHWGAASSSISYWTYPWREEKATRISRNRLVKQLLSSSPEIMLEAAGRLFYKHIG